MAFLPGCLPTVNHKSRASSEHRGELCLDGAHTMRIYGPSGLAATAPATTAGTARRAASGAFVVAENDTSLAAGSASALRTVGGIDALIALQGVEDPAE